MALVSESGGGSDSLTGCLASVLLFCNTQFGEFLDDIGAMSAGIDRLVDEQQLAVLADIERMTKRYGARCRHDTVGARYRLVRIAENGIVQLQRFGVALVRLRRVATGREEGNVVFV